MADPTKTYTTDDAELIALLEYAAATGERVRIRSSDGTHSLDVSPKRHDIWANYDPEKVRAALHANAELPDQVDPKHIESIIRGIRKQRGQDSSGRPKAS